MSQSYMPMHMMGEGTVFSIALPAYEGKAEQEERRRAALVMGEGKILVMDDEEYIRTFASNALKLLGYTAVVCSDGAEAIDLYRNALKEGQPFLAVIMDLTIPGGMGGRDAARRILEIDTSAKIIVSSGYSSDPIIAHYSDYGFCGCLPKPYQLVALGAALAEVIGKVK